MRLNANYLLDLGGDGQAHHANATVQVQYGVRRLWVHVRVNHVQQHLGLLGVDLEKARGRDAIGPAL